MKRIEIERDSFDRGYADGRAGRQRPLPSGIDSFSYWSGYIEGKALRTAIEDLEKERGGR